ncbi:MAG: transporter [Flavipsychrobacter sp.]|jgi:DHA1 family tetracycline resistance protein-like MFS transporter|nr:transporter [Flavipsychrobacter sp.]
MPVQRNAALGFIFITILIDVIGFGIIIPVLPALIKDLTNGDITTAAKYGSWLMFAYAVMQFLFSPIIGGLSDRYGRRPVLLFSLLGLGIDYVFQAFSPTILLLFIGRIIAGIAGASFTTATAYIADISTPEKRAQNFGLVGVAFGLGFIIGPGIGGLCAEWGKHMGSSGNFDWTVRLPFIVAAVFSLLNVLYGFFVLPESLQKENRRKFEWKRANPIGSLMNIRRYPIVSGLAVSFFLIYIAAHAVQSNWAYYTIYKFNWSSLMVGISLSVVGVLIAIVQGGLIRITIPKLGEKNSVYAGLSLNILGMMLFAFADQGWMMFLFLVPYCLGGICGPALQGIISNQVPANAQGELQGALTSLMSITSFIGPLIMNNIFAYFTGPKAPFIFSGMPFILGSLLILLSIIFAIPSLKHYHRTKKSEL